MQRVAAALTTRRLHLRPPALFSLSGVKPLHHIYRSTSNTLTLRFLADLDYSFSGYFGRYDAVAGEHARARRPRARASHALAVAGATEPLVRDCGGDGDGAGEKLRYTDAYGVLVSPLWPNEYPNAVRCVYRVAPADADEVDAIRFRVNFFETERDADIVTIADASGTTL